MATSIVLKSGSLFCGNPIVVAVNAESVPDDATFHRVKLEVTANFFPDGDTYRFNQNTYILSSPAKSGEQLMIDVSSALRSVSSDYLFQYAESERTLSYLSYTLKAYDEYMQNGILNEKVGERDYGSTLYALLGGFSDMERYRLGSTLIKPVQKFSRKPASGEVCDENTTYVYTESFSSGKNLTDTLTAGPTVKVLTLSGADTTQQIDGRSVYIHKARPDSFQFQFVNSLGGIETATAISLPKETTEKESSEYTVTAPASFNEVRRNLIKKLVSRKSWSMSSGPVDEDWYEWWCEEFLQAEQAWVYLSGTWVPCSIVPDEDTEGTDWSKSELSAVSFTVKLNIQGGIRNLL